MKRLLLCVAVLLGGCDRKPAPAQPKAEGISDIQSPTTSAPPVQTALYEAGYQAGDLAGESAVKERRAGPSKDKLLAPTPDELAVLALSAAADHPTRAEKWQRGYAAGYRDGFLRAAQGKR